MRIEEYRGVPFLYREREISYLIEWFNEPPQRILFIYGPKSSGKTTIISYIIDNYLIANSEHWIKYINLRETLIGSYDSFLDAFFIEVDDEDEEVGSKFGINAFGFKAEIYRKIKRKQINLFRAFLNEIETIVKQKGKKSIMIIDEIQKLRDIYI